MNNAAKKRLMVVGIVIVAVAIVLFTVVGSNATATTLTVDQAVSGEYDGKKIQVSGSVVQDSYTTEGSTARFSIAGEDSSTNELKVSYNGAIPSSFGNGVTAICTGRLENGVLTCTELATKCPSKYASAEGAVTANIMLATPASYVGQQVKLAGYVAEGSLAGIDAEVRFIVTSQGSALDVAYDGALPEGMEDGTAVVVTGVLDESGKLFVASDVAVDASVR